MAVSGEIVGEASSARPQVSRVIDLAFAVDEQYIPHLTVALTSIARHAGKGVLCRCWVVCAVASWLEKPRSVLEQQGLPLDIRHLPVEQSVLADAPISRHISVASYQRLLIPSHLPQDISRVLYLDADIVVEADLTDLFDHPLGGRTIGAVFDASVPIEVPSIPQPYFNAGVLVVDRDAWVASNVTDRALQYLAGHTCGLRFHDQDVLNAVLKDSWQPLEPRWNVQTAFWECGPSRNLTAEEIEGAFRNPGIIHYTGYSKPWQFGDDHPWRDRYHTSRHFAAVPRSDGFPSSATELVRRVAKCVVPRRCRPGVRAFLRMMRGDASGVAQ